jgi:hypothetical protein
VQRSREGRQAQSDHRPGDRDLERRQPERRHRGTRHYGVLRTTPHAEGDTEEVQEEQKRERAVRALNVHRRH